MTPTPESRLLLENPPGHGFNNHVVVNGTAWKYELRVRIRISNITCAQASSTAVRIGIVAAIDPELSKGNRTKREVENIFHSATANPSELIFKIPPGDFHQQPFMETKTAALQLATKSDYMSTVAFPVHAAAYRGQNEIPYCRSPTQTRVPGHSVDSYLTLILQTGMEPAESSSREAAGFTVLMAALALYVARSGPRL